MLKATGGCRKGQVSPLLWEIVYGVLGIAAILILYTIFTHYGSFLLGGGPSQDAEQAFASLAIDAQKLSEKSNPFAVIEQYPYTLGQSHSSLIGFDAGEPDITITKGISCLAPRKKPALCGTSACICLFDSSMNLNPNKPEEHIQGIVSCRKITGIATIHSLAEQSLRVTKTAGRPFGAVTGPSYTNLGDNKQTTGRSRKQLIKNLKPELQATHTLFIIQGDHEVCYGPERVYTSYLNGPLYIERVIIDGTGHLTISPASPLASQRYRELLPLLGITTSTITSKLSSGDPLGAIRDTTSWISAHESTHPSFPSILRLQAEGFEQVSKLPYLTASLILEQLGDPTPLPDLAPRHAGMLALKSYTESLSAHQRQPRMNPEEAELALLAAVSLAESLAPYHPDVSSTIIPQLQHLQTAIAKTSPTSTTTAFLAARHAAKTNSPDAIAQLSAFIAKNPDNDQTKEARYLLAQTHEQATHLPDALAALQSITARHQPPELTTNDGRILSAPQEINRICSSSLSSEDIYEICHQLNPESTCPQPDLVLLPREACQPNLLAERRCRASPEVAEAFAKAQQLAANKGKTLLITSAYRTVELQRQLHQAYLNKQGPPAAKPSCLAPHVTGGAIDVTIKGDSMGHAPPSDLTHPNRQLLERIMCMAGFTRWKDEYWHYEIGTWRANTQPAQHPTLCAAP